MNIKRTKETIEYGGNIPIEIMFKLKEYAEKDRRSVNSLILRIMKKHLNNPDYTETF